MKRNIFRTFLIILLVITMPFPVYADYGPVRIDGYYDDWEDKPHTEVYPGKNPPEDKINYVSLFRDEDNVYVHVIFAHKNNQDVTNMIIDLETNLEDEDYFVAADLFDWFLGPDSSDSDQMQEPDSSDLDQTQEPDSSEPEQALEPSEPEQVQEPSESEQVQEPSEPEQAPGSETDSNLSEGEPAAEEESRPESSDQNGEPESGNPNILSNREQVTYFLTADNENSGQSGGTGESDGIAADATDQLTDNDQEGATDTDQGGETDQSQGSEPDNTEQGGETDQSQESEPDNTEQAGAQEDETGTLELLDLFDPINIIDLNDIVDQLSPDTILEPEPNLEFDLEELNPKLNIKKPEWYGKWGLSVFNGLFPVGSGYFTRTEGEPDELELVIPLSSIIHDYEGITEISMVIKKLGRQNIMCVGASSEPYIGVAVGAGIAMLSAGVYSYKKKRPLTPGREK